MNSGETESGKQLACLTPSTRKLIEMRKGKGPGMLTEEEKTLLRQSAKEIAEELFNARNSSHKETTIENFVGMLTDKTNHVATLEEIGNAIASGWANQESSEKD
jgi:hypothetical protein